MGGEDLFRFFSRGSYRSDRGANWHYYLLRLICLGVGFGLSRWLISSFLRALARFIITLSFPGGVDFSAWGLQFKFVVESFGGKAAAWLFS